MKVVALILIALVVPSALLVYRRRRQWAREAAALDLRLAIQREALEAQRVGQVLDESLRATATARRLEADKKRREAAQIASGKPKALIRAVS